MWIYLDKPSGIRSMEALSILKKVEKPKKAGIGGILDSFACGLLPIACNESTKEIEEYNKKVLKQYIFTVKWGISTNTYDYTGEKSQDDNNFKIQEEDILKVLPKFTGWITQTPPIFSNIKINGERAHSIARKGMTIDMPSRNVYIHNIELLYSNDEIATLKCCVGSGTYIRSIAVDMAKILGTLGHLIYLRRESIILNDQIIYPTVDLQYYIYLKNQQNIIQY